MSSWTLLTPEEAEAETLRPLAEGTDHPPPAAGGEAESWPASGEVDAEGLPTEAAPLVSEVKTKELNEAPDVNPQSDVPLSHTDAPILSDSGSTDRDQPNQLEGGADRLSEPGPDLDSFSNASTHLTPSGDEPPALEQSVETLQGAEFSQQEEHQQEGDKIELTPGGAGSQEQPAPVESSEMGKGRAQSPGAEEEEGSALRKRRSLLASLERIGRAEEEEEEEEVVEEFKVPQREEDSGFTVNKCILGAIILLGIGTVFFSGVFMDLDQESGYGGMEPGDSNTGKKQEWPNPAVNSPQIENGEPEHLVKMAEGMEQISVLQAQLQTQREELRVAEGHMAEGVAERLRWEEENSRLREETASLPILQKENERMKQELESVPALQRELETLRAAVTQSKRPSAGEAGSAPVSPTVPPRGGQPEKCGRGPTDRLPDKEEMKKYDAGKRKERREGKKHEWREGEKRERKDGGKTEWKEKTHEQGRPEKESEWKKEKVSRGDEGKPWKEIVGKKERTEKSDRKEWKEKMKHEKLNGGEHWRGEEKKKKKEGKDRREKGFKESGKEKWEKKYWKDKGEKKELMKDGDLRGKDQGREEKEWGQRKQWEDDRKHSKGAAREEWRQRARKDDQEQKEKSSDWKKDSWSSRKQREESKSHGEHKEHLWGEARPAHSYQPEERVQQKLRFRRRSKSPQHCSSVESCALAEGLLPVRLPDFTSLLQTYLTKAEETGVQATGTEELRKLTAEFFADGVFLHDQRSFRDFAGDVGDALEDLVEGEESDGGEDSAIEDEMEGFQREALRKFAAPEERKDRVKGETRKEGARGKG